MGSELVTIDGLEKMANAVAKAGMWKGINTPEKALSLMLLCQAEGLHPMTAVRRYDIIDGGAPTMKSEALLAEFYSRGGAVVWMQRTAEVCEAKFIHPKNCPQGVMIKWDMKDAARAGLANKFNWKSYPRQMLCARVVSEGVQVADPGAGLGMLTTEEAADIQTSWGEQAAQYSADLTGEPTTALEADSEIQTAEMNEKESRKLRADLNKTLQACTRSQPFRDACKAFQEKYSKGIWVTLTKHTNNAQETFGMLAREHRDRVDASEHFVSIEGQEEWRARLMVCNGEKDFRKFEGTIAAYPEYDNQDNHDAISARGRELGLEEYAVD